MSSAFEASQRLDAMALEAGIQIARYQNPLDTTKTQITANPLITAKLANANEKKLIEDDPMGNEIGIKDPFGGNEFKFGSFSDQNQSQEHQLPINHNSISNLPPIKTLGSTIGPLQPKKVTLTPKPTSQPSPPVEQQKQQQQITQLTQPQQPQQPQPQQQSKTEPKSILKKTPQIHNTSLKTQQQLQTDNNDSNFSIDERNEKAAGFFKIIETKLVPELKHYQTKRESTARNLHDLEQLIESIRGLQIAQQGGQKTMECNVNLGCKVLAEAKFVNTGKIIIELGLGIFAEMPYEEATQHISIRCDYLAKQLQHFEDKCCFFSSRIKGMHEAIGVLTDVTHHEEKKQLRDVWFQ
jgi:prefoldin subunit 5